jgi:hypothetical protein
MTLVSNLYWILHNLEVRVYCGIPCDPVTVEFKVETIHRHTVPISPKPMDIEDQPDYIIVDTQPDELSTEER